MSEIDEQIARILQAINTMAQSAGWLHLKEDFKFQIENLQAQINEPGRNEMKYSEGDLMKMRLKILKEIVEYPERFMSMLQTELKVEEQDPYNQA